ncbi:unnamed protein product [Gongylonema pulchrum]|uniref:HTH La-type RNA-binding domain-containing protein n=1 Tax=Gongylonema pulchrum TaxID=637853 RepID=A0A183EB66_9BILA|nr:unnamed protein product [Gongylonema pulchrum]
MLDDLMVPAGDYDTPPTPMLPWWFTAECESQLLAASAPVPFIQLPLMNIPTTVAAAAPPQPPPSVIPSRNVPAVAVPQTAEQVKQQLKAQLEYYFSRENLMTDRFLRCQMDNDQYVPIRIIAGFPKVKRLTSDYNLVVKVLRESSHVQVDEKGEREVASMFTGGPPYLSLQYGLNNSWYVTFESEEATQRAFLHLQNLGKTFNNKPICARIKTGGAPCSEPINVVPERSAPAVPSDAPADPVVLNPIPPPSVAASPSSSDSFDLGQILASYGYVPQATFKPGGATVVHISSAAVNMAPNRTFGQQRLRNSAPSATQQLSAPHFRGSSNRGRGGFMYNHQRPYGGGHREFSMSSTSYQQQHGGGARRPPGNQGDAHRDGYRDRNNDPTTTSTFNRPRGRQNRGLRSRTPVESHQLAQNDVRRRYDYEQTGGR